MADAAGDFFREGKLAEAVAAANAAVRAAPADLGARVLLAELLVFDGNLERADVILDAAGDIDPQATHRGRRVPPIGARRNGTPAIAPRWSRARISSANRHAAFGCISGHPGGLSAPAISPPPPPRPPKRKHCGRPRIAGHHGDVAFDDLRDACDLHIGFIRGADHNRQVFLDPHGAR